ncbi:MAG: HD-GYP domain-containing protein [Actinobacteria bacterium]|nr:HD-GYP domain-containing protein [Actinomycetota bacterium]
MEALYSPDAIQSGTASPGAPRPGPAWDARLRGLVTALATRVPGTAGHCRRVAAQSRLVAGRLGLDPPAVARVECAARIHDVGKIIVSAEILDKPGPLTPAEYAEIQRHVVFGARLAASLEVPEITAIVRHHHERLDGSGYPDGLRGTEIPLGARIVAVVDSYDALASPRPYREALTPPEALEVLQEEAGHTLDPVVVAAFAD